MEPVDSLRARFLRELQALDGFRAQYKRLHPWVPMDKGDPDLRHLVEALAYYSARAHGAMERSEASLYRRLFSQFFPYLLTPQPAWAIAQVKLRSSQVEPVLLPRGAELQVTSAQGATARFITQVELRVVPAKLTEVSQTRTPDGRTQLRFRLEINIPRNLIPLGKLRLYVSHLEDFWPAVEAWLALRAHVKGALVRYGVALPDGEARPCEVSFGLPPPTGGDRQVHPLELARSLFHFPEQELFIEVDCPPHPQPWQVADVILDLGHDWPEGLHLGPGSFIQDAVPMTNALAEPSEPIEVDGSRRRWPLRHPDRTQGLALLGVQAVYRSDHRGLVPLRPGVISGRAGGYEIDPGDGENAHPQLVVDLPNAFLAPVVLTVDARWHQPAFSEHLGEAMAVRPYRRSASAFDISLIGGIKRHQSAPDLSLTRLLTQVLALRMRARLDLDEVRTLLAILGREGDSPYRNTLGYLAALTVRELSLGGEQGLAYEYRFELGPLEREEVFRADALLDHVYRLLDAWIPGAGVRVEAFSSRLNVELKKGVGG